ncbi:hypothetical protein ONZ45_g6940 [Pleurotus djamor]|nr:hypothetical protein ONZ45_g6940 [Pleurotus djamor]
MSAVRRSARIKRARENSVSERDNRVKSDNDDLKEDQSNTPRPVKRRKPNNQYAKSVAQRRKGKLRNLPQMPLDILLEIFAFLDPLDILHLARTTRAFRAVLMNRSTAISLWKNAFANVPDVPEKPGDVSEPAWTNFLFSNHCYILVCFAPYDDDDVERDLSQLEIYPDSYTTSKVAYEYFMYDSENYYYTPMWLLADLEEFKVDYAKVLRNDAERKSYITRRSTRFEDMTLFESLLEQWNLRKMKERSAKLDGIRSTRFEAIKQKLVTAGWDSELKGMSGEQLQALRQLPGVRVAQPLTNGSWLQIESRVITYLEAFRENRLKMERTQATRQRRKVFATSVGQYISSKPFGTILPSPADLYFLDSFASRRRKMEEDPTGIKYSASDFDDILAEMPRYSQEWQALCTASIIEQAKAAWEPPIRFNKTRLGLAITSFRCYQCGELVGYPQMLVHGCHRFRSCGEPSYDMIHQDLSYTSWIKVACPKFCLQVPDDARAVVRACGYDPNTSTWADMGPVNVWLVGTRTPITESTRYPPETQVMRWRKALESANRARGIHVKWNWTRVNDEALVKKYDLAELEYYNRPSARSTVICAHCQETFAGSSLINHMKRHKPEGSSVERSDFEVSPHTKPSDLFHLVI